MVGSAHPTMGCNDYTMGLESYSTITSEQVRVLAEALAQGEVPVIDRLERIADYEELSTFAAENLTPIFSRDRNPIWRLESVASRLIEAFAIASHESLSAVEWEVLARIIVEHAEYLYTYHNSAQRRNRLEAGAALAMAGCCCRLIPQAAAWRLAGFARIAEAAEGSSPSYLVEHVDAAFEIALALNLPILEEAVEVYDATFNRDFRWEKFEHLQLTDVEFFDQLDLDRKGLEGVKSELALGNVEGGKSAYEAFLRRRRCESELHRASEGWDGSQAALPTSMGVASAKSRLECVRRLSAQTGICGSGFAVKAALETSDIGVAALLYPERRHSEQLLKLALRRCGWIVHTRYFPDGCYIDGSTRTQQEVFTHLYRFYHLAKLGGVQFSQKFDAQMDKILEAFIYLSQPDYTLPSVGIGGPSGVNAAEGCSLGVEIFDRQDLRYIASEGRVGEPPKETSYAFPYAGYYVMRDRWRPDAQYLLFDARHLREGGRPHEDKLSFLLCAYGRPLIIGGKGQRRGRMGEAEITPAPNTRWITTSSFDFVEGWNEEGCTHDGEDAELRELIQKRSIFYVRGEYFILHDLVLGEGEHRLEQNFQIVPVTDDGGDGETSGYAECLEGGMVRTANPNLSNIVIAPTDASDVEVGLRRGKTSSRELTYLTSRALPTTINVLLFPLPPHTELSPEIRLMEVAVDADVLATGFSVAHGEFTDFVLISDDGFAEMRTSELEFRGEYGFLRLDGQARPQWCGLVNGQFLGWRGEAMMDLPEVQESYVKRLVE